MTTDTPKNPDFSLVILCYRSEESAIPFIEKAHRVLNDFKGTYEVILVGNYLADSKDKTPQIVCELSERLPFTRSITLPKKGMMGWDMRTGMDAAKGEFIGIIDGDGQFPIEAVAHCRLKARLENLDFVKTYRVKRDDGIYRWVTSKVFNLLFKVLFRFAVNDVNSKPKIIRREAYLRMNLQSDDWFADAEMVIRAHELGLKTGDLPIHFYAHTNRQSFVKPSAILEFIKNLVRYRLTGRVKD